MIDFLLSLCLLAYTHHVGGVVGISKWLGRVLQNIYSAIQLILLQRPMLRIIASKVIAIQIFLRLLKNNIVHLTAAIGTD